MGATTKVLTGLLAVLAALGVVLWYSLDVDNTDRSVSDEASLSHPKLGSGELPTVPDSGSRSEKLRVRQDPPVPHGSEGEWAPEGATITVQLNAVTTQPILATVCLLDKPPANFMDHPSINLWPDALDQLSLRLAPESQEAAPSRLTWTGHFRSVPVDRPLWILVAPRWKPKKLEVPEFTPMLLSLGAQDASEARTLEFTLARAGSVSGRLLDGVGEPSFIDQVQLGSGVLGKTSGVSGEYFEFRALRAGMRTIEILTVGDNWLQRLAIKVEVKAGRHTNLGDIHLPMVQTELSGRAIDAQGNGVEGMIEAWDGETRWGEVPTGDGGSFRFVGDVQGIDRVIFKPYGLLSFQTQDFQVPSTPPPSLELQVGGQVNWARFRLAPKTDTSASPGLLFCSLDGPDGLWFAQQKRHTSQTYSAGMLLHSAPEGTYTLTAWSPSSGTSARFQVQLHSPQAIQQLSIPLKETFTEVTGILRLSSGGSPFEGSVPMTFAPDRALPGHDLWDATATPLLIDSGPFSLKGLPANAAFKLIFFDDYGRPVVTRKLDLQHGEIADLGTVLIELP